jgi:hypothetical protein
VVRMVVGAELGMVASVAGKIDAESIAAEPGVAEACEGRGHQPGE